MTLTLRYMQLDDIRQVSTIDHASFNPPWPINSYAFEINQSTVSHMVTLEEADKIHESKPLNGIRGLMNTLWKRDRFSNTTRTVLGYGGLWKIADEAHISTIAIHPDYRGHRYGEILLAGMYRKALALDAGYIVLEVRVSNRIAQNLYRKYGFVEHDVKKNYYRSNNEDAYDMRATFTEDTTLDFYDLYDAVRAIRPFVDNYSDCPHPRLG